MSTSEPIRAAVAPGSVYQGASEFGILSPAELSRLANEMFQALPEELQQPGTVAARTVLPANSAFTGNPYAAVPGPTAPAVPGLGAGVADAQAGQFVPHPQRAIAPEVRQSVPGAPTPTGPSFGGAPWGPGAPVVPEIGSVPGAPGVGTIPVAPTGFGFLDEARPIFAGTEGVPAGPGGPVQGFSGPGEGGYGAIPSSLVTDVGPSQVGQPPVPPSPSIPGALGNVPTPVPAFSFMEDARPLFTQPAMVPGPVPAGTPKVGERPFAAPLEAAAPQVPGAVAHAPASGTDHPNFPAEPGSEPRQLGDVNVVPQLEPIGSGADDLGDLGLSSYSFDVEAIRRDFPILKERVNGRPLIWLDNGATTQKPQSVIDRISYFYEHENSNVHRAAHELAARATDAYESAREKTRRFLNASSTREIIFVRGATEAINLVAQAWGRRNIQKDDEIVISWLEHHANIVPWQMLCAEKGARLRVAPVDDSGQVLLDEYEKLLGPKTKLVSITHVSNALGTVVPVKAMVEAAHRHGARVLVDGAQAVSHMRVDVQSIGCDFYVFSGHKVFAPTGIGVVFGKQEVLEHMPPWQGGGNMIQDVTFEKTIYQGPPQRFEAGTGNIADAVGLGAAIDYLDLAGIHNVARHEHVLLEYATEGLLRIPGLRLIGTAKEKAGVLSFVLDGFRTEEIGDYLNRRGIAVRGGHHCAQPILRRFGQETTLRATLALYNTCEEIDALIAALWDLRQGRSTGLA